MKQNKYIFKINYKSIGGNFRIYYGDVIEIMIDGEYFQGIIYEINRDIIKVFVQQDAGGTMIINRVNSEFRVLDTNKQTIANSFSSDWWDNPDNQIHINNWAITRPINIEQGAPRGA